tara:strand:+ start:1467 stop:2060 length:594 start_codon:yes stop_codon:yes gene_type:complete
VNLKKIKYKVIDNFLPKKQHKLIYDLFTSNDFPWFMQPDNSTVLKRNTTLQKKKFKNIKENFQLNHMFISIQYNDGKINSEYYSLIKNFIKKFQTDYKIKDIKLLRAKINLQPRIPDAKEFHHNTPHVDFSKLQHNVLLYYVNDSDGDTFLFDKGKILKRVSPKANRLLVFDGTILHTGSHPIKSDYRLALNINCHF